MCLFLWIVLVKQKFRETLCLFFVDRVGQPEIYRNITVYFLQIVFIIIIIIIIMLCRQHEYPWPSLATSPYRSLPLAGLQGYIPYLHWAAVYIFEQAVLLLPGHMWGSIGVHHSWVCPCFSSSVLHVWFI